MKGADAHARRHGIRGTGRRRRLRLVAEISAGVLLLGMALTSLVMQGPRFGRLIERNLPRTRGTIHVGSGSWTWPALWALWRGRPASLAFDDVVIVDPEGVQVFRAARVSADLRVERGPTTRIDVSDLRVQGAAWRFAPMRERSDIGFLAALSPPAAPRMRSSAKQPTPAATPPPADTGKSSPESGGIVFRILDAHLEGLDAVFAFSDWDLTLRHVHASGGALVVDTRRGAKPVFTFTLENAEVRGGGRLAVLRAPLRRTLTFSGARLDRVATTKERPDALILDASAIVAGRSTLTFAGGFQGIYRNGGASPPPTGMSARIRVEQAADALAAILGAEGPPPVPAPAVSGDRDTELEVRLDGPFSSLTVSAKARAFDARWGALGLDDLGFELQGQLSTGRLRLTNVVALSPQGGRLHGEATLERARSDRGRSEQKRDQDYVTFDVGVSDFIASDWVPPPIRPLAAGEWNGSVAGRMDVGDNGLTMSALALTLTRPPGSKGPRMVHLRLPTGRARSGIAGDVVALPAITAEVWGGRLTATGTIALAGTPRFNVRLLARRIAVERIVRSGLVTGAITARADVRGTMDELTVRARFAPASTLRLFGESFRLPATAALHVDQAGLTVRRLQLFGAHGGGLDVDGRLSRTGAGRLRVGLRGFPFAKLPGFADSDLPLAGHLDGELKVSFAGDDSAASAGTGATTLPRQLDSADAIAPPPFTIEGRLSIRDTTFQGQAIGGGVVDLSSGDGGALRVRGTLIDGVAVDGTLSPAAGGVSGDARLRFDGFRLDPFLAWLPGGATAAGTVSGSARARLFPRKAPTVDAHLTTLHLRVTGPPSVPSRAGVVPRPAAATRSPPPPTIDLRAIGNVDLFAEASSRQGGGPSRPTLRLSPTRFEGSAGMLILAAEINSVESRGSAHGRLDLGVWSNFVRRMIDIPWLEQLAGHVDLDIKATAKSGDPYPTVVGNIGLLSRGRLRWKGEAMNVAINDARIDLRADRSARVDVPLIVAGSHARLTGGWSRAAQGQTRVVLDADGEVDAHLLHVLRPREISSASGRTRLHAHLETSPAGPRVSAALEIAAPALMLTVPALGPEPVRITRGHLETRLAPDVHALVVRELTVRQGRRSHAIIGASADGPAKLSWRPLSGFALATVDIPVRGDVQDTTIRPISIEEARFVARLGRTAPDLPLRLKGEIDIVRARVDARAAQRASAAPARASTGWRKEPILQNMNLDLGVRSHNGAITVEVPYAPDVRVDVDYRVQGTATQPRVTGDIRSAGPYGRAALFLYRLLNK